MKISMLDANTLGSDLDLSPFEQFGELKIYDYTEPENVARHIDDSDIIIVNKVKINESNIASAKNLKLICEMATGYDNIDLNYCKSKGIAVCNVVGYSSNGVAQITVSMALSLISHLEEYRNAVVCGQYSSGKNANILTPVFHEISGLTWGIVGYGNIGKRVADIARALGCRIMISKKNNTDKECVDIDTLCANADIISVHTPLTPETRNLINRERIALMKSTSIFINMARGAVADEASLTEAIISKKLGGLGIDVYTSEPFPKEHPYSEIMKLDNVCLTPHMAWGAYESRVRCRDETVKNIKAFLGETKRNRVC